MRPSEPLTVVDFLRARALSSDSSRRAYTFLNDGETSEVGITWVDVDRRARALAAEMQRRGLNGQRAVILCSPGLDYITAFFGCLYAGAIAVPSSLPRGRNSVPRLKAILDDALPAIAIANETIHRQVRRLLADERETEPFEWLIVEHIDNEAASGWQAPAVRPGAVALLQYTSGSTRSPRGVMLTHRNLVHNLWQIQEAFAQTDRSVVFSWLPLYHDMGLIGTVLQSAFVGSSCILMTPMHFMQKPVRWLQGISRYRATTSGGPNFAYDLCVDAVCGDEAASLDLSSWAVAFNGAELVRAVTLERFAAHFARSGFRREAFRPCYGLAEASLLVSTANAVTHRSFSRRALQARRAVPIAEADPDSQVVIGCGRPSTEQRVAIADPETRTACEPGNVGEIWVAGASVGTGYWCKPDETREVFAASLAGESDGSFMRTGDLGFQTEDGVLFITGRLKDLVIVRGRNIHPEDIEATIDGCHSSLVRHGCAAFSIAANDEEKLVVVQEVSKQTSGDLSRAVLAIRGAIAETHEVRSDAIVLVRAGSIPRTSSGKIRRGDCRVRFLAGELDVVWHWQEAPASGGSEPASAPRTPVEDVLLVLWKQTLGSDAIEVHDRFFDVGGDSLRAAQLVVSLGAIFSVQLSIDDLLVNPTIASLAEAIRQEDRPGAGKVATPPERLVGGNALSLSFFQESIWFVEELFPHTPVYVIPVVTRLEGPLDAAAVGSCLQRVVNRHEALRTTFRVSEGHPVQVIASDPTFNIGLVDVSSLRDPEMAVSRAVDQEARRPFDLAVGPLVRATIFRTRADLHVLLITLHHIICDHWSLRILLRDLSVFYSATIGRGELALPSLMVQPGDIAVRERQLIRDREAPVSLARPTEHRGSVSVALDLGADRARPLTPTFRGASRATWLDPMLAGALRSFARKEHVTMSMALLASFGAYIHRQTDEDRFAVACPLATRHRPEAEHLIGLFVTTVAVPFDFGGGLTFGQLVRSVRDSVIASYRQEEFRNNRVMEEAGAPNRPGVVADVQLMFSFLLQSGDEPMLCGVRATVHPHVTRSTLADLCLSVVDIEGRIRCDLEYNTDLFDQESIDVMLSKYLLLLAELVREPHRLVSTCDFLLPEEKELGALMSLEVDL